MGITSVHHGMSINILGEIDGRGSSSSPSPQSPRTFQNLSKVSVIPNPTVFASGLYDLSPGSGAVRQPHNSSVSSNSVKLEPKFPQAIDPDPKEQQDSGLLQRAF